MMAQFPCLPLWTDAWVADTHHLTWEQRGIYMDLLVLMWRTPGCHVPDDNGWLQQHLRCDKDALRDKVRPIINEFCHIEGNRISQKRLQQEFLTRFQFRERMSKARKRWLKQRKGINTAEGT